MSIGSAVKVAGKIATVLSGVAAGATVLDEVGKRTGILKPGEGVFRRVVGEVAGVGLQLAGAPAARPLASAPVASAPALPPAPVRRTVCPECEPGPILSGAGEEILLTTCDAHVAKANDALERVDAMYDSWAQHEGIDLGAASKCGKKPVWKDYNKSASQKFSASSNTGTDIIKYASDLSKWQECVQAEKEAEEAKKAEEAKAKAAKDQAVKAAKKEADARVKKAVDWQQQIAASAVKREKDKAAKEMQALLDAQAAAKTAEEKEALQKQIDEANAAKMAADKLAAELQAQARDAQHKADIQALEAKIAAAAKQPSGMEALMQQYMMQQMAPQPHQPAYQPYPVGPAPGALPMFQQPAAYPAYPAQPYPQPYAPMYVEPAMAAPVYVDPLAQGFYDPTVVNYSWDFAGGPADQPIHPEMAGALGLPAETLGEARDMYDLRQLGWSDEELASLAGSFSSSTCPTNGCGVR